MPVDCRLTSFYCSCPLFSPVWVLTSELLPGVLLVAVYALDRPLSYSTQSEHRGNALSQPRLVCRQKRHARGERAAVFGALIGLSIRVGCLLCMRVVERKLAGHSNRGGVIIPEIIPPEGTCPSKLRKAPQSSGGLGRF